jgi:hypothetical protein
MKNGRSWVHDSEQQITEEKRQTARKPIRVVLACLVLSIAGIIGVAASQAQVVDEAADDPETLKQIHAMSIPHRAWINEVAGIKSDLEFLVALDRKLKTHFHLSYLNFTKGDCIPLARSIDFLETAKILRTPKKRFRVEDSNWAAITDANGDTSVLMMDSDRMNSVVVRKGESLVVIDFEDGVVRWYKLETNTPKKQ